MLALRDGDRATTLTVLPETGHLTPLESPRAVADIVIDLVRSIPARGEEHL